jgi:hypothetical protein
MANGINESEPRGQDERATGTPDAETVVEDRDACSLNDVFEGLRARRRAIADADEDGVAPALLEPPPRVRASWPHAIAWVYGVMVQERPAFTVIGTVAVISFAAIHLVEWVAGWF